MPSCLCQHCGYDLAGIPPGDDCSLKCPECDRTTYPGGNRNPSLPLLIGTPLAPTAVSLAFIGFSAMLGWWSHEARTMGLAFVVFVYSPAATLVGAALGFMEYGKPQPFWRRWWHRPAIVLGILAANAAVAMLALSLM